jgi:hypothetical protein
MFKGWCEPLLDLQVAEFFATRCTSPSKPSLHPSQQALPYPSPREESFLLPLSLLERAVDGIRIGNGIND